MVASQVSRCQRWHVAELHLGKKVRKDRMVFGIMSHKTHKYHAAQLRAQLVACGISPRDIFVVQGGIVGDSRTLAGASGRLLRHNEVVHWSWLRKWLPAAGAALKLRRGSWTVVYLEATARVPAGLCLADALASQAAGAPDRAEVLWFGYRRVLAPGRGYCRSETTRPAVEGSKLLLFRGAGLELARTTAREQRLRHFDMMLSASLPQRRLWIADSSVVSCSRHMSVPNSGGGEPVSRAAW